MVVGKLIEIEGLGSPLSRLHSLWTLMGLGALEEGDLLAALADGEATGVRNASGKLVAHYGAMPRPILFFGQDAMAVQIGDVMVLPEARGVWSRSGPFSTATRLYLDERIGADNHARAPIRDECHRFHPDIVMDALSRFAFAGAVPREGQGPKLAFLRGIHRGSQHGRQFGTAEADGYGGRWDRGVHCQSSQCGSAGDVGGHLIHRWAMDRARWR